MVRAKFRVSEIKRSSYSTSVDTGKVDDQNRKIYRSESKEMQTIVLNPVYGSEPGSENKKFWDSSPSGKIELGTINLAAAVYFELDKEYYIDFTKAE